MEKTTFLSRNFPCSITITLLYEDSSEEELKDDVIKLKDFLEKMNRRKKLHGGSGIRFLIHSSICPTYRHKDKQSKRRIL